MMDLICDVAFLLFTLFVYVLAFELHKSTIACKIAVYGSCALMIVAYVLLVYVFKLLSIGAGLVLCITLPSLFVLGIASKYKDARFIITFCFIDTASLIIALIQRFLTVVGGLITGIIALVTFITVGALLLLKYRHVIKKYNDVMNLIKGGWITSTLALISVYVMLLFVSQYPSSISSRPEYYPALASVIIASVAFYSFFVSSLIQKSKIYETNIALEAEREWHKKAYVDPVTGVKNRMAYVKRINDYERKLTESSVYYAIMIDVNSFKQINDTLGHHRGDEILCHLANLLTSIFPRDHYRIYRIGGDEFAIIGFDVEQYDVDGRISAINVSVDASRMGYSVAAGRAKIDNKENQAFEKAFIRADEAMYESKRRIKEQTNQPLTR